MKVYSSYKNSGIKWLGKIPLNWNTLPLKHAAIINRQALTEQTNENHELQYIDIGNVNYKGIINPPDLIRFSEAPSRARRIIKKNDTIISTVRTYLKAVAFIDSEEKNLIASTGFATLTPISKIAPKFLYYMVSSQGFVDTVTANSVGVSYPAITSTELTRIHVWLPPFPEQRAIADFLDRKTAQIDTLIEKKQRQIELLQEHRTLLINQAVTKGLNPDVPMKDSGIEWLGEVPAHWDIVPMKWLVDVRDGTHDTPEYIEPSEYSIPFVTSKDFIGDDIDFSSVKHISQDDHQSFIHRSNVDKGDVLMSMIGANIGKALIVIDEREFSIKNVALLKTNGDVALSKFILNYIRSGFLDIQIETKSRGGAQSFLSLSDIRNLPFFKMPQHERESIVNCLDERTRKIDVSLRKLSGEIALLQEYRTALISAMVTGKIDVRGEAR